MATLKLKPNQKMVLHVRVLCDKPSTISFRDKEEISYHQIPVKSEETTLSFIIKPKNDNPLITVYSDNTASIFLKDIFTDI